MVVVEVLSCNLVIWQRKTTLALTIAKALKIELLKIRSVCIVCIVQCLCVY